MKVRHWFLIDILLFLLCLVVFWLSGGSFMFAQEKPQLEKVKISCLATNRPMDVYSAQNKKYEEVDDWHVDCTIKCGDKVLFGPQPLVLPYPATYADAMGAIDEFRKTKAAEILKQLKEKEK